MTIRRRLILFITIALLILTHAPPNRAHSQANAPHRLTVVGQMGGPVIDSVPLPDGSVLAAEGSALIRVSGGLSTPQVIARSETTYGEILDLAAASPYVLALSEEGIAVLPESAEGVPAPQFFLPGGGQSMSVSGSLIAVAAREAGLRIVRMEQDGRLTLLNQIALAAPDGSSASAFDVALSADQQRAYVATGANGTQVVDLTDLSQPRLYGVLANVRPAEAVTTFGALVAVGSEGRVIAVDPSPGAGIVGTYAPIRQARRVVIQDDYAYIADAAEGVKILWLAAPDRPVQVYGEANTPANDLALVGNILYIAGENGLRILDVSSKYRPLELGRATLPGSAEGIALDGAEDLPSRAFLAMGEGGLSIIDVRNLSFPITTAQIPLQGTARSAEYVDSTLFVALDDAGLAIFDASTPNTEAITNIMALPGRALDLAARGNSLLVAAGDAGVLSLDITRPNIPTLAGVLPLEPLSSDPNAPVQEARSITISGKRGYVAQGDGFLVIDVSNPNRVRRLTRIDAPAEDIGVNSVYAYAVSGSQVGIYDARATAEPVYLNTYRGLSHIAHLEVQGTLIFATSDGPGPDAAVISMAAPDAPAETDNEGIWGETHHLTPSNGDIWLSAGFAGLRRYGISEGGALVPRGSYAPAAEASVLATDGSTLMAGGRHGWSALEIGSGLRTIESDTFTPNIIGLAVDSSIAAAVNGSEVILYDLSHADGPIVIGRQSLASALGVGLDTNYVYAAGASGLSIFNRRYFAPVAQIGTPAPAVSVALRGLSAYVALADGQIAVVDLGDPSGGIVVRRSLPTRRPTMLIPGPNGSVYGLADDTLSRYFVNDLDRMGVIEEGTLPLIAPVGFFSGLLFTAFVPGEAVRFYDVTLLDEAIAWNGTVDFSASSSPVEAVAVDGSTIYAAYGDGGLGIVDRNNHDAQQIISPELAHALLINTSTLFSAGSSLSAWDVSTRGSPVQIVSLPLTAPARYLNITADGRLLVSMDNGLSIVSWDAKTLNEIGHLITPPADRAALMGSRAYLALHRGGLLVADLSDATHPTVLFTYTSPSGQFVTDLLPLDERNLLVSWENGIDVLDVGTPAPAPHLIATQKASGSMAAALTLSPDQTQAAVALGKDGVALLGLANPAHPEQIGFVDTPGEGRGAALDGTTLYVADGVCGLRMYDASNPQSLKEIAAWRDGYGGSIALVGGLIYVGGGNELFTLKYDPDAPSDQPFLPQSPDPANGAGGIPLNTTLRWGSPSDSCDTVEYDVYFGIAADPPLIGHVAEDSLLDVGKLAPGRTYHWRVEAIDAQGSRSQGPVWSFTTARGIYENNLPPQPPIFMEALKRNPAIPFGMLGVFLLVAAGGAILWRQSHQHIEPSIPEWYSTQADDDEIE